MHDLQTIVARNNAVTDAARVERYNAAREHWLTVGYSYVSAHNLACVLHGATPDIRANADRWRATQTNMRREDML